MIKRIINSDVFKMVTALAAVGIISAVSLSFIYSYSMPKITENMNKATQEGIKNIFPEAGEITKTSMEGVSEVKDKDGKALGYAFVSVGNGYQGPIKIIAGVDPGINTMIGIEILESQETPGLGAEIAGVFRKQFSGLSVVGDITYVKNKKPEKLGEIEAITGATISSRAVVNILNGKINEIKKTLK